MVEYSQWTEALAQTVSENKSETGRGADVGGAVQYKLAGQEENGIEVTGDGNYFELIEKSEYTDNKAEREKSLIPRT